MPVWMLILISVVFTTIFATAQGIRWALIARRDREHDELRRRLGGGAPDDDEEYALFLDPKADTVARSLGGLGEKMSYNLRRADANYGVSTLATRMIAGGAIGLVAGTVALGPLGAMLAIPLAYIPYALVLRAGNARIGILIEQLPDALELMARSLSAGLGLSDAFRLVAEEMPMPIAAEFGRVTEEIRFGREYREAFDKLLKRNPGPFDLRIFVSSVMLQRETGGNLIEILESIADTIRARFLFDAKVRAMTSEARFSALVLGSLPMFVVAVISFSSPDYLEPMTKTSMGNILIATCVVMYGLGTFIMRDVSQVEV